MTDEETKDFMKAISKYTIPVPKDDGHSSLAQPSVLKQPPTKDNMTIDEVKNLATALDQETIDKISDRLKKEAFIDYHIKKALQGNKND